MGRQSTGAYTTQQCRKIDLRWMLKNGYLKENTHSSGQMSWTCGSTAGIEAIHRKDEKYIRLNYTVTDRQGIKTDYNYRIEIETIPSNLGKGEILYFVCPESGKRAKVLYSAYGHHKYIHREWYLERYGLRLYYNSQISSKIDYNNTMYFSTKNKVEALEDELYQKNRKRYYNGKPTKELQKLDLLIKKRNQYDHKREEIYIKFMEKYRKGF